MSGGREKWVSGSHERPSSHHFLLPGGLLSAIDRLGRCSEIAKLNVASAQNLLYVAEQARLCEGLFSMRLAGDMLEVYLRGIGLKHTRRRYMQKSAKRLDLHGRLSKLQALDRLKGRTALRPPQTLQAKRPACSV